tara:strand:+ start:131 stop:553 length:423 start_codon:yes stop_codon:yes gene_type:complete
MSVPSGSDFFGRPIEPNPQIAVLEHARATAPSEAQALMGLFAAGLSDHANRAQCLELASACNPDAAEQLSGMYLCNAVIHDIARIKMRWVARCYARDEATRRRAQALCQLLDDGSRHWGRRWGALELRIYDLDFGTGGGQ